MVLLIRDILKADTDKNVLFVNGTCCRLARNEQVSVILFEV